MELDLKSYVMGFLSGRGGSTHTSVLFKELERAGFNENVYKVTVREMVDDRDLELKGVYLEKNS